MAEFTIPEKEMKKILEKQFKVLWGEAFGIVEDGDLEFGNFKIKKDNSTQIAKLKAMIADYEKDVIEYRDECQSHFNEGNMEIYEVDLDAYKTEIFGKELWTVKSALRDMTNRDLDRYRDSFNNATPEEVFQTTRFILDGAKIYVQDSFPKINLKTVNSIKNLQLDFLNEDYMLLVGVIGLGIRSELLHRMYPGVFPIMTRRTLWGMYFLTDESEFVVDENNKGLSRTSHQWNYEYDRMCYYSNFLMNIMETYLGKHKIKIKQELRYGYINMMLVEFAKKHKTDIDKLYTWKNSGLI